MLALYGTVMLIPDLRGFFELAPLPGLDFLLIGVVVATWGIALRFAWRARLFERLLNLPLS
jgi:hypothetical protein